jgi:small GTP-binding protein
MIRNLFQFWRRQDIWRRYSTTPITTAHTPLIGPASLEDVDDFVANKLHPKYIRNFSIIAHIDHGKTTLSGAMLHMTNTIRQETSVMYLDGLQTERERGITIRAHICSMFVKYKDRQVYLFNLIDTPGHVDFNYEVSRALNACEGAVLLVDATQGIQAQTLANYELARKLGLVVVPALNKIDSPEADVNGALEQLTFDLELDPASTTLVSARQSLNVDKLLEAGGVVLRKTSVC